MVLIAFILPMLKIQFWAIKTRTALPHLVLSRLREGWPKKFLQVPQCPSAPSASPGAHTWGCPAPQSSPNPAQGEMAANSVLGGICEPCCPQKGHAAETERENKSHRSPRQECRLWVEIQKKCGSKAHIVSPQPAATQSCFLQLGLHFYS